jgi:hypothetical protein
MKLQTQKHTFRDLGEKLDEFIHYKILRKAVPAINLLGLSDKHNGKWVAFNVETGQIYAYSKELKVLFKKMKPIEKVVRVTYTKV